MTFSSPAPVSRSTRAHRSRVGVLVRLVPVGAPIGALCWATAVLPGDAVDVVAIGALVAAAAAGAFYSWDRTTAGDRARWMRARMDGRRVPLAERLRARFAGLPQVPSVDPYGDQGIEVVPGPRGITVYRRVEPDPRQRVWQEWLCTLGRALDAAGYASGRAWTETVASALVAAGPVPVDAARLREWMDTVSAQLLAAGYLTRIEQLQDLTRIAVRVGLPDPAGVR